MAATTGVAVDLRRTYWLTRVVFTRVVAALNLLAFLIALHQNEALIGSHGLTPVCKSLDSKWPASWQPSALWSQFNQQPTLLAFWCDDSALRALAVSGVMLSAAVLVQGGANLIIWLSLYALYLSLVNLGTTWYSFGWETQLLETTIWMAVSSPWLSVARFPSGLPSSWAMILMYRFLVFKIMLGAGLIKIRGDECWQSWDEKGCLNHHYETQPNPHILSRLFHFTPVWFHAVELGANHFAELVAPWLVLLPRPARIAGGVIQVSFMATIALSGNLAFLNHLTAAPAVWCFDDACWTWAFSKASVDRAKRAEAEKDTLASVGWMARLGDVLIASLVYVPTSLSSETGMKSESCKAAMQDCSGATGNSVDEASSTDSDATGRDLRTRLRRRKAAQLAASSTLPSSADALSHGTEEGGRPPWRPVSSLVVTARRRWRFAWSSLVLLTLAWLNAPVVRNLLSATQSMNRSFDRWHVVNTYGAFGSVHSVRTEIVVRGTRDADPQAPHAVWKEYEWVCKPGALSRQPRTITPYHLRLDWLGWFAGSFYTYQHAPWMVHLVRKLTKPRAPPLKLPLPPAKDGSLGAHTRRLWVRFNEVLDAYGIVARDVRDLLSHDPFKGEGLPKWVRVDKMEYRWVPPDMVAKVQRILTNSSAGAVAELDATTDVCASVPQRWKWLHGEPRKRQRKGLLVCTSAAILESGDGSGRFLRVTPDDGKAQWEIGTWWARRHVDEWLPPLDANNPSVLQFLEQMGWARPRR